MLCLARASEQVHDNPKRPSPFGGAGGLSGERPPLNAMSDEELDVYAEVMYNRSLEHYEAVLAPHRKMVKRRRFRDYTQRNCEEAWGSR